MLFATVDNILIKCKKGFLDFIVFLVWCVVDASSLVSETLLGCQGPFRPGGVGGGGCGVWWWKRKEKGVVGCFLMLILDNLSFSKLGHILFKCSKNVFFVTLGSVLAVFSLKFLFYYRFY